VPPLVHGLVGDQAVLTESRSRARSPSLRRGNRGCSSTAPSGPSKQLRVSAHRRNRAEGRRTRSEGRGSGKRSTVSDARPSELADARRSRRSARTDRRAPATSSAAERRLRAAPGSRNWGREVDLAHVAIDVDLQGIRPSHVGDPADPILRSRSGGLGRRGEPPPPRRRAPAGATGSSSAGRGWFSEFAQGARPHRGPHSPRRSSRRALGGAGRSSGTRPPYHNVVVAVVALPRVDPDHADRPYIRAPGSTQAG